MLQGLPEIEFVDRSTAEVEQDIIQEYESITGRRLASGDPVRLFLEALAYIVTQQRSIIDHAAKQNLLAYAQGEYLDQLGILTDTMRLEDTPARVEMEFKIGQAREVDTVIPQGTRITPGSQVYFATLQEARIKAGETSVKVTAECLTRGDEGNGYPPGDIDKIVDPVRHITSAANTETSSGGAEKESDESFRARIPLAPGKYSSAGPEEGYKYWARQAHPDILDASVDSPVPGQVDVYILLQDGELPDQEMLDKVEDELNHEKIRPLSDSIQAKEPEKINYDIQATYYIHSRDSSRADEIRENVEKALDKYKIWQRSGLGRDIDPSELTYRLKSAGASRVDVKHPEHISLDKTEVAREDQVNLEYGGLEGV